MKNTLRIAGLCIIGMTSLNAATTQIIYGNNASSFGDYVEKFATSDGSKLQEFHPSVGNGRGVVVVGNTIYSTVVNDSKIYKTDATTGLPLGFIQTQNQSMSTIAWDGSTFWTTDYAGSNKGFQIDPTTGNNIKTVTFSLAQQNMDGMEYFNGKLIVNREDAGNNYDIYDLDGNVLTANFIQTPYRATGIAFDGTDFWVSDIFNSKIHRYDGTTGLELGEITLQGAPTDGFANRLIEDLSVDYEQRQDTGHGVPDGGSSLALLILGLTGIVGGKRVLK